MYRLSSKLVPFVAASLIAAICTLIAPAPAGATTPAPVVTLDVPATPLIGTTVNFTATFDNTATTATGYGPYIDLYMPTAGADGATVAPTDGLSFTTATYLGTPVTATPVTLTCAGDTHPLTGNPISCPPQSVPGDVLWVLTLPFGSLTADQPTVTVDIEAELSNLADVGTPLTVAAAAGFRFGSDPLDNPLVDPPIAGAFDTAGISPTLIGITKTNSGPESETATGPNFPRTWTIDVYLADGQTVTDFDLTDALPNNVVVTAVSAPGATVVTQPPASVQNPPGNEILVSYPSLTGNSTGVGTGPVTASMTVSFWVPDLDADTAAVLRPTGSASSSTNTVTGAGDWTPIDPRDPATAGNATAGPATDTITNRSLAIQKSSDLVTDNGAPGPTPGDTIEWTLEFQVSDYFSFDNVEISDVIGDGLSPTGTWTLDLNDATGTAAGVDLTGYSTLTTANTPCGDGSTTATIDVAAAAAAAIPATGGTLTGGRDGVTAGATFGRITYRTQIDSTYRCQFGAGAVDLNDTLANAATITGDVAGTSDSVTDTTSESVRVVRPTAAKTIYARNGVPLTAGELADPQLPVAAGDVVTYRLRVTSPITNINDLELTDYLPLPTYDATTLTGPVTTWSGSPPAAGSASTGPADTHTVTTGDVPSLATNSAANSVTFDYPDVTTEPGSSSSTIDLLFSVAVSTDPFADGLFLTNQARLSYSNSPGDISTIDSVIQVELTEPDLVITKGVVATDTAATFSPTQTGPAGVSWSPPGTLSSPRFSGGTINSTNLAARPINSNLAGVDAGDTVTYAIVVENTGSGIRGAFDVTVSDLLPAEIVPATPANLSVTDGAGNALTYTGTLTTALELTDPSPTQGSLAPTDPTSGSNIAIITFDATLTAAAPFSSALTNTAEITNYSGSEAGPTFVRDPLTDPAVVTTASPTPTKTIVSTNAAHTSANNVTIGEQVTYQLSFRIPEGTTSNVELRDTMDNGLVFGEVTGYSAPAALTATTGSWALLNTPTVTNSGRTVTWPLGTLTNSDTNNTTDETITVDVTAYVTNVATNTRTLPTTLVNRAQVASGGTVRATGNAPAVTVVEPNLSVAKTASVTEADAGDTVTWTVTVTNPASATTVDAFEAELVDTLPDGLTYLPGSWAHTGGLAPDTIDTVALTATWSTFPVGSTSTFQVQGTVDADAVTLDPELTNTAEVETTSLPGTVTTSQSTHSTVAVERTGDITNPGGAANTYRRTATSAIPLNSTALAKTISATSEPSTTGTDVTIGEQVTYDLAVTLPEGNLGTVTVTDQLPDGIMFVAGSTSIITTAPPLTEPFGGTFDPPTVTPSPYAPGGDITWAFTNMAVPGDNDPNNTTLIIRFDGIVVDTPSNTGNPATTLDNTASVIVAGQNTASNTATVTVVEPKLEITKTFTPNAAAANDTVSVTIEVTNTGTSTAYDTAVTDTIDGTYIADAALTGAPVGWTAGITPTTPDFEFSATDGTIAPAATATFTLELTLRNDVPAGGTYLNTASANTTTLPGTTPDERTTPTVDASDTLTFTAIDLTITKNDGVQLREPGDTYTYTLDYSNSGDAPATGTQIVDTLDENTTFVSANSGGTYNPTTREVTWNIGTLTPAATGAVTVTVTVNDPVTASATTVVNTATISDDGAHGADQDPVNNTDTDTDTLEAAVDIAVTKTADVPSAEPGDLITWTITVTNLGTRNAADVELVDTIGDHLEYVDATGNPTQTAPDTLEWAPFDLAGGDTISFQVRTRAANPMPSGVATLTNTATATTTGDINPANNTGTDTVNVSGGVDIEATKTDGATGMVEGWNYTYTITISNNGPRGATGVTAVDTLPDGLTYLTSSDAGSWNPADRTVTWTIGTLEAGDSATRTIDVTVDSPLPTGTTEIVNTVTATDNGTNGPDTNPANNTGTDINTAGADLSLVKTHRSDVLVPGTSTVYDLVVTNNGPEIATGFTLTELLPAELTNPRYTASAGTFDPTTGRWTGTLPVGSSVTITVTVDVALDATGDITNEATVGPEGFPDGNGSNNTGNNQTGVVDRNDMMLTKNADRTNVSAGDTITWAVSVTNLGPSRASNVTVVDTLPAGVTYTGATGDSWSCDLTAAATLTCRSTGRWAPNETRDLSITTVDTAGAGELTNSATVTSSGTDPTPENNTDTATVTSLATDTTAAPPATPGSLARTGPNLPLAPWGAALVAVGLLFIAIDRRRYRPTGRHDTILRSHRPT